MPSKVDKKIIEILQSNARIPISEIAREVDMSENGVRYRLDMINQDLEKSILELKRVIDEERAMKEKIIMERDDFEQDVMDLELKIDRMTFRMNQEKGHNLLTMKSKGMSYCVMNCEEKIFLLVE